MTLSKYMPHRMLAVLLAICASAGLAWLSASKPVLLKVGTRIAILNPFRSRAPERIADIFLRAASGATCSPDMTEDLCQFVRKRPLPAKEWRLVNRCDSARDVKLFYRLSGDPNQPAGNSECLIAEVHLGRVGKTWKTLGYGLNPGPCNGTRRT
jgi:hypothetical protein